jgi:poly-gamma-glutamate capsule biosynthesis protein CapA/YwtB (metallophosphatase superfamily)
MRWRSILLVTTCLAVGVSCRTAQRSALPTVAVTVTVVDEAGAQIRSARMITVGSDKAVDIDGVRELRINQPVAGTIEADGYLTEPFVVDPTDQALTIKMFSRVGPSGSERLSFQFGGDVMMGRRYQQPASGSGTPVATSDAGARSVVRYVAPIMAAADASTVNLETVVGQLPAVDAYPAKRFLLQSPPVILAALHDLGVDLVTLGNNHAYDWRQAGVASTIAALDAAGIPWAGAGMTAVQAQAGRMIDVRGTKVGVVSATTVNGDFVNDSLPATDESKPDSTPDRDFWQYEERMFGFGQPGDLGYIAPATRRPGAAWAEYTAVEQSMSAEQSGKAWAALTAVYPELQDWVARRGHGGAAPFDAKVVADSIAALRTAGAALVVVEIHGGFQFSDVGSEFAVGAAHAAIDAGADLVVGHHPHVLQGFEWYKGHLIAYSLGNFVFDQDFLSTFPTVILRTIFEGDRLIDARVIPLTIDRYRPMPVGGRAAQRVVRLMDSRSALAAFSDRIQPRVIAAVLNSNAPTAAVTETGMTGEVGNERTQTKVRYLLDSAGQAVLPPCALAKAGSFAGEVGLDLIQWGDIDDVTADDHPTGATQWVFAGNASVAVEGHNQFVRLRASRLRGASVRPVARSTTPLHRWYAGRVDTTGGDVNNVNGNVEPVDGQPKYSVQLQARGVGVVAATLRVGAYDVNDTDPTTEPVSTLIHETEIALPLPDSAEWQSVDVDVSDVVNTMFGKIRPNAVLVSVVVPTASPVLDLDEIKLIEWRDTAGIPAGVWMPADAVRGVAGTSITVAESGCAIPPG